MIVRSSAASIVAPDLAPDIASAVMAALLTSFELDVGRVLTGTGRAIVLVPRGTLESATTE